MNKTTNTPNAKKTSGPRNRSAGHAFELQIVNLLREIGFPHVCSTRSESRSRDGQKIDIMNKNEGKHGRLPYNLQCKNVAGTLKYAKVLSELPDGDEINVVLHNQTERRGTRFMTKGQYAFMHLAGFFRLVQCIHRLSRGFELLNTYFDCIPEEDKTKVASELEALGL